VIFINDPLRHRRPDEAYLRATCGLTPAECRVALLLSDGHAPRVIAEMIGVTENTVRSQIKSIFSKTGVRRQSELIRFFLHNAGPVI
jgi:DNA-binding CsgD family transcriptional regulator